MQPCGATATLSNSPIRTPPSGLLANGPNPGDTKMSPVRAAVAETYFIPLVRKMATAKVRMLASELIARVELASSDVTP